MRQGMEGGRGRLCYVIKDIHQSGWLERSTYQKLAQGHSPQYQWTMGVEDAQGHPA